MSSFSVQEWTTLFLRKQILFFVGLFSSSKYDHLQLLCGGSSGRKCHSTVFPYLEREC